MTLDPPVRYRGTDIEVRLGDHVETRIWFFWKVRGRVVYVPGISPAHPEFEHHGLKWVGIRLEDGGLLGTVVNPGSETNELYKGEIFLRRDPENVESIQPGDEAFGNDAGATP